MKNLTQLREQIDAVDKQIVELFEQRMQISADVAKYKISIGKKVFDKEREQAKLASLKERHTMILTVTAWRNCFSRSCP